MRQIERKVEARRRRIERVKVEINGHEPYVHVVRPAHFGEIHRISPSLAGCGVQYGATSTQGEKALDTYSGEGARASKIVEERWEAQSRRIERNTLRFPAFCPPTISEIHAHHEARVEDASVVEAHVPAIVGDKVAWASGIVGPKERAAKGEKLALLRPTCKQPRFIAGVVIDSDGVSIFAGRNSCRRCEVIG